MATVALSEAGIVYDIVAIPDLPADLEGEKPKWWIPPTRILVSSDDANEARSLVEPFKFKSGIEVPNREDSVRTSSQITWKGPPDAPFIQRAGARLIGSFFVCVGLFILYVGFKDSPLTVGLVSATIMFVGIRLIFYGLPGISK